MGRVLSPEPLQIEWRELEDQSVLWAPYIERFLLPIPPHLLQDYSVSALQEDRKECLELSVHQDSPIELELDAFDLSPAE